jgi:hypothetical protein
MILCGALPTAPIPAHNHAMRATNPFPQPDDERRGPMPPVPGRQPREAGCQLAIQADTANTIGVAIAA